MTPEPIEVLEIDVAAAKELVDLVGDGFQVVTSPNQLARSAAPLFAVHRRAHRPGPLLAALDQAYTALTVAGYNDDQLFARLREAREFARQLPVRGQG